MHVYYLSISGSGILLSLRILQPQYQAEVSSDLKARLGKEFPPHFLRFGGIHLLHKHKIEMVVFLVAVSRGPS